MVVAKSIRFTARIRYWDEQNQAGLAVADIPDTPVDALGGRRQMRVKGTLDGKPFTDATMLVQGGGFCVGVTKDAMHAAAVAVGGTVTLALEPVPKR